MLGPTLFVSGLALVALAVGFLAGLWWGVLVAGVVLVGLGVLTVTDDSRGAAMATADDVDSR